MVSTKRLVILHYEKVITSLSDFNKQDRELILLSKGLLFSLAWHSITFLPNPRQPKPYHHALYNELVGFFTFTRVQDITMEIKEISYDENQSWSVTPLKFRRYDPECIFVQVFNLCISKMFSQTQLLETALHTPQHCVEGLQFQLGSVGCFRLSL